MDSTLPLTSQAEPLLTLSILNDSNTPGPPTAPTKPASGHMHVFQIPLQDLKSISKYLLGHKKTVCTHIGILFVLLAVIVSSSVISSLPAFVSSNSYCTPGGDFDYTQNYNEWASEHTFQVTLAYGNLTFTQAKAIDIVWDVTVGKGGQFILAWISFLVFSKSLSRMLEQTEASISYDAFRAIVFERPSLGSTFKLLRDLIPTTGWRSKVSIFWIVIASIYVVAFPTMVSAMTGYTTKVDPYFEDGSSKFAIVGSDYFHRAIYRIEGADRIQGMNLAITYVVGSRGFSGVMNSLEWDYYYCWANSTQYRDPSADCALAHGISSYIENWGANSRRQINTTLALPNGTVYTVVSPSLAIEVYNTSVPGYGRQSSFSTGNSTPDIELQYMYTATNGTQAYNENDLNKAGSCDSQSTYMWGFSFILLFVFSITTNLWVLGMYAMWIDAIWNYRLDRTGRKMGFYRGVADLSNAMWKDMLREPNELASESTIRASLSEKRNGGRIKFDEINYEKLPQPRREGFRHFMRNMRSIHGWAHVWTRFHWTWLSIFFFSGLICFIPTGFMLPNGFMIIFAGVFNLAITGVFWLITVLMVCVNIPTTIEWWHQVPLIGDWIQPRTKRFWTWTVFSAVSGCFSFFVAISLPIGSHRDCVALSYQNPYYTCSKFLLSLDGETRASMDMSVFIGALTLSGFFWLVAIVMSLTGLFSTLWRWLVRSSKTSLGSHHTHMPIPMTEHPIHSPNITNDIEPESSSGVLAGNELTSRARPRIDQGWN